MNKPDNVFSAAHVNRLEWNKESDLFIELAPHAIRRAMIETPGFAEINKELDYSITTEKELPGWLQVQFGVRPLRRPAPDKSPAYESGPTLVYSRGPTGQMVAILFPVKSKVASVAEDSLILRQGYFDYWDLYTGIRRDVRDLIAYAYVTSIDLSPTVGQKLRIAWLRFASDQHIDGRHRYSPLRSGFWKLFKLASASSFSGLFKFLAPATLGWFIGRYGTDWISSWLP